MQLQASHTAARADAEGNLVLLADQDRAVWDATLIAGGLACLDRAGPISAGPYQLQAAIAACDARAAFWEETDRFPQAARTMDGSRRRVSPDTAALRQRRRARVPRRTPRGVRREFSLAAGGQEEPDVVAADHLADLGGPESGAEHGLHQAGKIA